MSDAPGRASATLLDAKDVVAREVTGTLYREMPELLERHGERGRARCLEDLHFTLEHLAPAVGLDDPGLFAGYARWLRDLLLPRGVRMDEIARSFVLVGHALTGRMPADEAEVVARCVKAGLDALSPPAEAA